MCNCSGSQPISSGNMSASMVFLKGTWMCINFEKFILDAFSKNLINKVKRQLFFVWKMATDILAKPNLYFMCNKKNNLKY